MKSKFYLKFDRRVSYGSAEHFFHFMWGYLLPSIHEIQVLETSESSLYLFTSCGPVMDKLTREVMQLTNCSFRIIPENLIEKDDYDTQVIIPRWDIGLLRPHLLNLDTVTCSHILAMQKELSNHITLLNTLGQKNFTSKLSLAMAQVKSGIMQNVNAHKSHSKLGIYAGCYLLIARSSEPDFYAKGGQAEIPSYGTSRRALLGIEKAGQKLRQRNIPVLVFEPGNFSLTEQIKVFQCCKGIIAIKGAEFANLIWMKPKSQVILINPTNLNTPIVQKELANILKLNYAEIEGNQGSFPVLEPGTVEKYLV